MKLFNNFLIDQFVFVEYCLLTDYIVILSRVCKRICLTRNLENLQERGRVYLEDLWKRKSKGITWVFSKVEDLTSAVFLKMISTVYREAFLCEYFAGGHCFY